MSLIEVVSPGNKSTRNALRAFVQKVVGAVAGGIHVLIVDLFPPGPRDPQGVHPLIWADFGPPDYAPPAGRPLTLAAYAAGPVQRAFVEPTAVSEPLLDMPLFLTPDEYVPTPLDATYAAAWAGTAASTRRALVG